MLSIVDDEGVHQFSIARVEHGLLHLWVILISPLTVLKAKQHIASIVHTLTLLGPKTDFSVEGRKCAFLQKRYPT